MRYSYWILTTIVVAASALAQAGLTLPVGQNLRDRPEQASDIVLAIDNSAAYSLNGRPLAASQLAGQLAALVSRTRDRVVYIRADSHLPSSVIDSASAIAARGGACVASFVGTQQPGTMSLIRGDAGPEAGDRRRAIDVQLPLPRATEAMISRQQATAIVLEVLPGPSYRINGQAVPAAGLQRRLREIFDPRPIKVLFVRADPATSYNDVFHAMDVARSASIVDIAAAPPQLTIGTGFPNIDLSMRVTARDDSAAAQIDGNVGRCRRGDIYVGRVSSRVAAPDAEHVFFEFQVEHPARRLSDGVTLRYPDVLRASGADGQVLAQFVVDTSGHPLPETFKVLRTTNDLFSQSVKDALPDMRFSPATVAGKPVRQLVQAPFNFTITP